MPICTTCPDFYSGFNGRLKYEQLADLFIFQVITRVSRLSLSRVLPFFVV